MKLKTLVVMAAMTLLPRNTLAQTATFAGRVTSSGGTPLGGANVGIPDAGIGAITNSDGRYSFNVAIEGTAGRRVTIVARYIGYKPQRLPAALTPGRSDYDFTLERDVLHLDAVVVTGTSAATSQKMTPFSVVVIDDVQIKEVPSASPLGTLAGKVAGVSFVTPSGQPGSTPHIRLRAATSLVASADPMVRRGSVLQPASSPGARWGWRIRRTQWNETQIHPGSTSRHAARDARPSHRANAQERGELHLGRIGPIAFASAVDHKSGSWVLCHLWPLLAVGF